MRLTGRITRWFSAGYGYAVMRNGTQTIRAFVHCSKIISLPQDLDEPVTGCSVTGELTNAFKRRYKDLPSLIDAEVGPPRDPIENLLDVLSGNGGAQ